MSLFLMSFPFLNIFNSLQSSLLFTFCQVWMPVKETAEIETGMAEKSSWGQANGRQKLGLVWKNRKKISKIFKDYFYLPFFLLLILCGGSHSPTGEGVGDPNHTTVLKLWYSYLLHSLLRTIPTTSPTDITKNCENVDFLPKNLLNKQRLSPKFIWNRNGERLTIQRKFTFRRFATTFVC